MPQKKLLKKRNVNHLIVLTNYILIYTVTVVDSRLGHIDIEQKHSRKLTHLAIKYIELKAKE